MRLLSRIIIILLALFIGLWFSDVPGAYADIAYYVAPSGSGSACTKANPCSLDKGLSRATSGDEVVLLDGKYSASFQTKHDGVTIRANNFHKATIHSNKSYIIGIKHENIKIQGLRLDGKKSGGSNGIIRFYRSANVIIEHNILENSAGPGICVGGNIKDAVVKHVIIRHNRIHNAGFGDNGEAVYVGTGSLKNGNERATDIQIYGNVFSAFTQNGVDLKPYSENSEVHHNIFETQLYRHIEEKPGNEGTIVIRGKNHKVYDNIIRDITDAGAAAFWVAATGAHKIFDNVVHRVAKTRKAISTREKGPGGSNSEVYNNIFCDLPTYSIEAEYGLIVHDNQMKAPQSSCDAEVSRILAEMQTLPGMATNVATIPPNPPVTSELINPPTNLSLHQ